MNIEFIIGGCAQENHDIIDQSDPHDIWFHISGMPSGHVICKIPQEPQLNRKELQKIIKQGAVICKEYSVYKSNKNVEIDYTKIANVKKLDTPGMVYVNNVKKMII